MSQGFFIAQLHLYSSKFCLHAITNQHLNGSDNKNPGDPLAGFLVGKQQLKIYMKKWVSGVMYI